MAAESGLEGPGLSEAAVPPGRDPDDSPGPVADPAAGTSPRTIELAGEPAPPPEAEIASRPSHEDVAYVLADIVDALRADPHSFSFFQAVRLLEHLNPERTPVGGYGDPGKEAVRFGVPPSIAFPASEIQSLDMREDAPSAMKVNFMGVTGPQGVLPHEYTLLVADRLRSRDSALADFLDIFHHRLISLFYQAWRKYRFAAAREDGRDDLLGEHVLDLIGLGMRGSRPVLPFPADALISRAGLLAPQPRGAAALQQLIEDFFGVPVSVEQFVGGWYPLITADRCVLSEEEEDAANQLGRGAVAGDEIWDQQARVRVRIGPVDRATYDSFLPEGSAHEPLGSLLRFFSHDQYEFEVQLVLTAADVPGVRLGGEASDAPRLGWSTWIRSQPRHRVADETILTLQSGAA